MEWTHAQLKGYADAFYGQYPGGKRAVIASLTTDIGRAPQKVLMIGDAPGDFQATENTWAAFYPIVPGAEEESWKRFDHEFLPLFLDGGYTATVQRTLVDEFFAALPEDPPWKKC